MSKRSPKSVEEKLEAVLCHLEKGESLSQLSRRFDVTIPTLERWIWRYQSDGVDGLKESHTWKKYSSDLKKSAVEDYLDGKGSTHTICQKYGISSTYVL
ncbi:Homeodomain-like domain-containing protein, partial [Streptococcus henryi]